MSTYNNLDLMSFFPTDELIEMACNYYVIAFPRTWKEAILKLKAERSSSNDDQDKNINRNSIPIASLNELVSSLMPGIIATFHHAQKLNSNKWILAEKPLPTSPLLGIITTWMRENYGSDAKTEDVIKQFIKEQNLLKWVPVSFEDLSWGQVPNGTARLSNTDFYQLPNLLTHLITSNLSRDGVNLPHGTDQFHQFHPAVSSNGAFQSELILWPPLRYSDEDHPYSPILRWKVVNRPWEPKPLIICQYGIRRWHWKPSLAQSGKSTLYFRPRGTKVANSGNRNHFGHTKLRSFPKGNDDNKTWHYAWENSQYGKLIQDFLHDQEFTLDEFKERPTYWMDSKPNKADLALVYDHTAKVKSLHYATPGVMAADRAKMKEALEEYLTGFASEPSATRVNPKAGTGTKTNLFATFPKDALQLRKQQREIRRTIADNTGLKHIRWEIHYQTDKTRDGLVSAITLVLGFKLPEKAQENSYHLESSELNINLVLVRQTTLLSLLDEEESGSDRILTITSSLYTLSQNEPYAICLLELNNTKGNKSDPYEALRLGFARTQRLTQFIRPHSEDSNGKTGQVESETDDNNDDEGISLNWEESAKKAVLDGLRQLGCYAPLPSNKAGGETYTAGVHMLRRNALNKKKKKYRNRWDLVPVIVVAPPSGYKSPLMVFMPGLETAVKYPEALLYIANNKIPKQPSSTIVAFLKSVFSNEFHDSNVLVFADAVRSRNVWRALQDGRMTEGTVLLEPNVNESIYQNLHFVRLRKGYEIPEYFARSDDGTISSPQGVFNIPRVPDKRGYYSLQSKPASQQKISPRAVAGDNPGANSYTSRLLEIVIFAGTKSHHREAIAMMLHRLRESSATYNDATAWPMPLHYAEKMEEYFL